jgi:AmmeMemoRadiSam system protein A
MKSRWRSPTAAAPESRRSSSRPGRSTPSSTPGSSRRSPGAADAWAAWSRPPSKRPCARGSHGRARRGAGPAPATAGKPAGKSAAAAPAGEEALTAAEKKTLLQIARDTLEAFVRTGRAPEITADQYALTPALKAECGAFVTLNKKNEGLRGCIGHIGYAEPPLRNALRPLYETVANMAVEACSEDPRFEPVRAGELKDIVLEVSVLSLARQVRGPEDFQVGRDGIIIRKEGGGAVFLPQVAPEQHWNREQTLDQLCLKAGWRPDEWRKPGMAFYTFTAQVFGEDGRR